MKLRIRTPKRILTRRERVIRMRELFGKVLMPMLRSGKVPPDTPADVLACEIIGRLDPKGEAPELFRLAAEQQAIFLLDPGWIKRKEGRKIREITHLLGFVVGFVAKKIL